MICVQEDEVRTLGFEGLVICWVGVASAWSILTCEVEALGLGTRACIMKMEPEGFESQVELYSFPWTPCSHLESHGSLITRLSPSDPP
jgi:hypothetical protein